MSSYGCRGITHTDAETVSRLLAVMEKALERSGKRQRKNAGKTIRKKEDPSRRNNRELARRKITDRVEYFAPLVGVDYNRIFIKEQKTRWGSCSSLGNLNFNWKLILLDEMLLDYVVVHELAHRKQMNHSPAFWAEVERVLPDYRERRKRLRECRV